MAIKLTAHCSSSSRWLFALTFLLEAAYVSQSPALAAPADEPLTVDVVNTDLEALLNMNITTVSNIPEKLRQVPASVFVLTNEDIRRSGATSIPEALRLVPGVQVARVDANKWAVSIRGFNARAANKLLVMIDGRTIYDPLFSGVLWETIDVMLEDVERIEVIKGPGGSTWGANAVNGVINIITKHAHETKGGLVTAGGGTEERALTSARYGAALSENSSARVYGRYFMRDEGYLPEGSEDDSYHGQGGFRFDSKSDDIGALMFQGNIYDGDHDGPVPSADVGGHGHNLLGRWQKAVGEGSEITVQGFYDHINLDTVVLGESRDTFELSAHHQLSLTDDFQFAYGLVYRSTSDEIRNSEALALIPDSRTTQNVGGVVQGHWDIVKDLLSLQLGVKVEHNDYSGTEVQPDAGITWQLNEQNTFWARVSRAVRTPSRIENDLFVELPAGIVLTGNSGLDAEELLAYEVGYRVTPYDTVYLDLSAFYNVYDRLVTLEGTSLGNGLQGDTRGAEASGTWQALTWLRLQAGYAYVDMDLDLDDDSIANPATAIRSVEGNNPHNQASLGSYMDLGKGWEFDVGLRYVDVLTSPHVPSYLVADARLAWKVIEDLEVSLVAQNLFDRRHFEQGGASSSQVQQGVYGKVAWTF